jgi:tyrosine-specific transport protein
VVFGFFVYLGTRGVDLVNRVFITGLIISYAMLIYFLPSHIHEKYLNHVDLTAPLISLPIVITAFGYHIIIPSLGTYLKHNRRQLILATFFGSLLTLVVYILWQLVVSGVIPVEGPNSIAYEWFRGSATSVVPLAKRAGVPFLGWLARSFSFFAIVTSFLGVSLSLADFVTDGFNIKKGNDGRLIACLLTFIPPLFFVFTYQRGFAIALEYSGAFVMLLLGLLPALMVWNLKKPAFYQKNIGKAAAALIAIISIVIFAVILVSLEGVFDPLFIHYRS